MQRHADARVAAGNAAHLAPFSEDPVLELALLDEQEGYHEVALARLEKFAATTAVSPRLLVQLSRCLQLAGRGQEARAQLEAALVRWPVDVPLHQQLAQLLWSQGVAAEFIAPLERAIAAHPQQLGLRLVAADLLRHAGETQRALGLLEQGVVMAPHSPAFLTSLGVVLDDLGRDAEALRRLRAAVSLAPQSVPSRRNLVPALLRAGEAGEALRLLADLLLTSPDDQLLIAWRATALRMAGDARYTELCAYPRLVRAQTLVPPKEYADIQAFNAVFARELTALHRTDRRPLQQSLRGGSQTESNLPRDRARHPAIDAFFAMIDAPIRDYMNALDAGGDHPTDRRRREDYRIAGSWSVQLRSDGFHTSHVHPQGWLSSAYYVELPEAGGASRAGWLKFGEPGMARPVCAADHFVEPRPGTLVLFPSCFWHGTVPFTGGGRRLTAAFDVLPI